MKLGLTKLNSSVIKSFSTSRSLLFYDISRPSLISNSTLWKYQANIGNTGPSASTCRQAHTNSKLQESQPKANNQKTSHGKKRKDKNSLRRVAVEAQRSRDFKHLEKSPVPATETIKYVTAFCAAEEYDIDHVSRILDPLGNQQDPYRTNLYPQVVHMEIPIDYSGPKDNDKAKIKGDLFVFPSGTIVGWGIPESTLSKLVSKDLLPASQRPHLDQLEEEDLTFVEDPKREYSSIKGDNIILGTKSSSSSSITGAIDFQHDDRHPIRHSEMEPIVSENHKRDAVLAKIVFSSGLAKSTKLAVLESQLSDYFDTTKSMLDILARGGRLLKSRSFVLSKTGQLLNIRAQLNLYSELTDSLPDVFWDSRSELGLEGYYDQVGKALDTNIRVKELNEKMNYAQEIADVLRETLSERHGTRLEWIIIILIAVEICFNVLHEFRHYSEKEATPVRMKKRDKNRKNL